MDNNGPEASKSKKRHREEDENSAESSDIDQSNNITNLVPSDHHSTHDHDHHL